MVCWSDASLKLLQRKGKGSNDTPPLVHCLLFFNGNELTPSSSLLLFQMLNAPVTFSFLTPHAVQQRCCDSSSAPLSEANRSSPQLNTSSSSSSSREVSVRCIDYLGQSCRTAQFTVEENGRWAPLYDAVRLWLGTSSTIALFAVDSTTNRILFVLSPQLPVTSGPTVPLLIGCQIWHQPSRHHQSPFHQSEGDPVSPSSSRPPPPPPPVPSPPEWMVVYCLVAGGGQTGGAGSLVCGQLPFVVPFSYDEWSVKHDAATVLCPSAEARDRLLDRPLLHVTTAAGGVLQLRSWDDANDVRKSGGVHSAAIVFGALSVGTAVRAHVMVDDTLVQMEGHVVEPRRSSHGLWLCDVQDRTFGLRVECLLRPCLVPL